MKIDFHYTLRQIGDIFFLAPLQKETATAKDVISITESGALLWKELLAMQYTSDLQNTQTTIEKKLCTALQEVYDVDDNTALFDIRSFLTMLQTAGILYKE